jgi:hypothetical protein
MTKWLIFVAACALLATPINPASANPNSLGPLGQAVCGTTLTVLVAQRRWGCPRNCWCGCYYRSIICKTCPTRSKQQ